MRILRQLVAFVSLPGVVAGVVPVWLARANGASLALAPDAIGRVSQLFGVIVGAVGVWLFAYSLMHFIQRGRGTLAPWDPPTVLVVTGPYRFVRNPMISGVIFVLLADALLLRSMPHLIWALTFFVLNALYIPALEEPMLRERFGDAYVEYTKHVRRLVPRLRPYRDARRLAHAHTPAPRRPREVNESPPTP
jgi:protein-S-isoprenylcysteine O-methyltransferase Ste14